MISSLQEKLNRGQSVMGTWSIVANATLVEIGTLAGLDFHILDLEHGAYDMTSLEEAIRASEGFRGEGGDDCCGAGESHC